MKEAAIPAEIREQVEGIFDGYGFDQGLLFGAVCAALSLKADHIETLEARAATLSGALERIAAGYDGEEGRRLIPLAEIGAELRKRQNIAKDALAAREASR